MADSAPLTGEALALDLVNTRPMAADGYVDLLATPRQLSDWLALEGDRVRGEVRDSAPTWTDLAPVQAVRAHTEAVVRALLDRAEPPASALRGLTEAQRAAPPVRELDWDGTAVTAVSRRNGPLGIRLAALLAEAAAEVLSAPAIGRLKECEADDCVMVFLPSHPRRRWCSPTRCGNRTRVARYYRRHSSGDAS
ncbi:CGNR zinc finger domain-containing protein [Streptomyces collinus]|uniref:RNA-binding Zn ribbon-like protein n=1 Tax=Streptomyces collinus TaxID=42684 RepID=A0AA89THG7_STRCU|nr:CGNR zinc finger domain-containing protein [Streptomyces collinus]MBB5812022.1 putative RNA-binding Zn ribbon-like protein [Streptomyces collinus]WMX65206.1 CGNR zinc finger domain-containing protein [Streptomyces collinus]